MISNPPSTHNPRLLLAILIGISLLAIFLRLWRLDVRPMHHDEANQAVRTGILLETGIYRYDPENHHGPSLYYLSLPLIWLTAGRDFSETTELDFRLLPVLFGLALVPTLFFLRCGLSVAALSFAAFLTAVSPSLVYYSRFYIQETLLVFFTFAAIVSGWLYCSRPSAGRAALTGVCLGLMFATKETSILAYFAGAVGLAAVAANDWLAARSTISTLIRRHLAWLILPAFGTAGLLFSSFFSRPVGLIDSVRSFGFYLSRGLAESFHLHPWYFYLKALLYTHEGQGPHWTEAFILVLALVGIVLAWLRPRPAVGNTGLMRFLSVYALVLTAVYSAISYKTPWCLLSFHHGLILLAGFGAASLLNAARGTRKVTAYLLLAAGLVHLTWLSIENNFRYFADPGNPYVYSQTSTDFVNLVRRIEQVAAVAPEGRSMLIEVIADPYSMWPLPWYLRRFSRVGYWEEPGRVPSDLNPAIVITTPELQPTLSGKLDERFQVEFYGLRPSVFLLACIRNDLWERFIERRLQPK
ncbi:MAG: flippase activity-associated protein Agl23 [Acidobacteriota bacterium]